MSNNHSKTKYMIKLKAPFSKENISEEIQEILTPAYNINRFSSYNGELCFTANRIYWVFEAGYPRQFFSAWSIDISEIESYKKTGIAGYLITLKDGQTLRFSNVFGKLREKMNAAIEKRR